MAERASRYLSAIILLCAFCIGATVAQNSIYWATWVTNTTTDSSTINWHGYADENGLLEYATSSYYKEHHSFQKTIEYSGAPAYQHMQLSGLEPNTSYIYCVRPQKNESAFGNRIFRTMPVSGPFTFIVVGDTRQGAHYAETQRFKYVADAIANEKDALFVFLVGDFSEIDYEPSWAIFFQCADQMLAKSAFFPVIGNHEYHNHSGDRNPPTAAVQYHSAFGRQLNYSFDCAGIRFIVLNSPDPNHSHGDDPQTSLALARSQASWLRKLLKNNMLGTFTLHHHPIWICERNYSDPNLAPWEALYHTYNLSANFAGHYHNYQRLDIKGIPYFVVGNGGGPCEALNPFNAGQWYKLGLEKQLGYLRVTVDPANNTATALEITVGTLTGDDDNEMPKLYNPPVINDTITFPLRSPNLETYHNSDRERIIVGDEQAQSLQSGSAVNRITISAFSASSRSTAATVFDFL